MFEKLLTYNLLRQFFFTAVSYGLIRSESLELQKHKRSIENSILHFRSTDIFRSGNTSNFWGVGKKRDEGMCIADVGLSLRTTNAYLGVESWNIMETDETRGGKPHTPHMKPMHICFVIDRHNQDSSQRELEAVKVKESELEVWRRVKSQETSWYIQIGKCFDVLHFPKW